MGAWLARLGVRLSHSSPFHPQTQGKDERFHRTLKKELLSRQGFSSFSSFASAQAAFDAWRDRYNLIRPHDAIGLVTPAARYQPSARAFPENLPAIEYDSADIVRKVQAQGQVHFRGKTFKVGSGLAGMPVALRAVEGAQPHWDIYFCAQRVARVSMQTEEEVPTD